MAYRGNNASTGGAKVKKVMTQAINLIFEFLKNVRSPFYYYYYYYYYCYNQKERVQIWLFENVTTKMEGVIIVST